MQDKHRIKAEIETIDTLKMLAESYEEISVIKIQSIKSLVLKTRDFLEDLSDVFYDVKISYQNQILEALQKSKQKNQKVIQFSTLAKNGKSVAVFLSANAKLFGDIIPNIFHLFRSYIEENPTTDIVIVGKLGKNIYEERKINKPYQYFELPDSQLTFEDLKPAVSLVLQYEKVTMFYGKFLNMITQHPASSSISGQEPLAQKPQEGREKNKFIFEPGLERILNFFETQIFTSLFKQTIHETQLARYASRIKAMEEALENIHNRMKDLQSQNRRVKRLVQNRKQIETFSGIALWGANIR